jgi:biopolymer transport protein ExbB
MHKLFNKPIGVSFLCAFFTTIAFYSYAQGAPPTGTEAEGATLDLAKVFQGSPIIYTVLFFLSMTSFVLWLYSILTLKSSDLLPEDFQTTIEDHLKHKRYQAAQALCDEEANFSASILSSGLAARKHGNQAVVEAMEAEGKRKGVSLWQRISLLNDIATIAPMLGLLGTVVGMFYAFYDVNRTTESLSHIFDGLGIAIGTTVSGLIVAILSIFFYTSLKFRVSNLLSNVENQVIHLGNHIDKS